MTDLRLHKIKISGPDINREFEVEETLAAQVYQGLAKMGSNEKQIVTTAFQNQSFQTLDQKLSPQEYLVQVNAKTNPEKIVAFTKYLMNTGLQSVELTELRLQFQNAREPIPGNFGRDVAKAVRAGWIAQGSDGKYYVTNTGEGLLESKFSSKKKDGVRLKSKTTVASKKALFMETPLRKEVEQLSLDPSLSEFPNYHELIKRADKILWLLAKAKSLGIDKLNQKEITFLSEKIGDHIPRKSISSLILPYIGEKLYAPIESGVRYLKILAKGENYLKDLFGGVTER